MRSYGVLGVAIGIVMGQAVARLITNVVEAVIMPVIEVILPGSRWQEAVWHVGKVNFKIGLIIAALINFFAVSLVVFFFVKHVFKLDSPQAKGSHSGTASKEE